MVILGEDMARDEAQSEDRITDMTSRYEESLNAYEIMNFPVITAFDDDSLKTIAVKMHENEVGSVVITNKKGKEDRG